MKPIILIPLLAMASVLPGQVILLEDFATERQNSGLPGNLWEIYLGEDPNQTGGVSGGVKTVTTTSGSSPYITFNTYPYSIPHGLAQFWIKSGTWVTTVNRMRFWSKCNKNVTRNADGSDNFQFGTYIKEHDDPDDGNKGAHYYHLFNLNHYANRWQVMEINMQPQHQVGGGGGTVWPLDPEWNGGAGVHYFDGLTSFYYDWQGTAMSNSICSIDYYTLFTQSNSPDDLVSSVAVSYTGTAYNVTWDCKKSDVSNYNVRYSTSSMKTNGWASGTAFGGDIASTNDVYVGLSWTSPAMAEQNVIYFAIKPTTSADTSFYEIKMALDPDTDAGTPGGTGSGTVIPSKVKLNGRVVIR